MLHCVAAARQTHSALSKLDSTWPVHSPQSPTTGPDSRRFRTRISWDPNTRWQLGALAARTEAGEEGLGDAFVPGQPVPDVGTLAGTVERTRTLEGMLRWWPAGGVDMSLRAGREWVENAQHVAGAGLHRWRGAFVFQLTR